MYRKSVILSLVGMIVLLAGYAKAEELTFDAAMKLWSPMVGEWTVQTPDGNSLTFTTSLGENASCYVSRMEGFLGVFTFDGGEKKLLIFSSHRGGGIAIGHWAPTSATIIEGSFTFTAADGNKSKHTGRFEILGKDTYTYAVDGGQPFRFTRKK